MTPGPSTDVLTPGEKAGPIPLKLVVVGGPDFGRELVLRTGTFTVGTDPRNDLVLTDVAVSRVHLQGQVLTDRLRLSDQGSTNGSYFEGVRFSAIEAAPGATVRLGKSALRVLVRSAPSGSLAPSERSRFGRLIGRSLPMRELFSRLERVGMGRSDVLIQGETGTGKELCAEALHQESPRSGKPFVVCDLAGLAPTLIESELFGHVRGAFTGAVSDRAGIFERADGGTVFLDEVGELPLELQPRLLRALERREVKRIGSDSWKRVDVRVVAATHRDVRERVARGDFREDLYHRLAVVEVHVPPLRDRPEDIPLLVDDMLERMGLSSTLVSAETRAMLAAYGWPGNVRELRNVVERVVTLGTEFALPGAIPTPPPPSSVPDAPSRPFKEAKEALVDAFERDYLAALITRCEGNVSQAAREAEIDRVHLRRLLRKHGLA
ncbi:MAG TPA: sigma 54-interacting transcriptional regulator [Myxococcaceae bacterium]|nr:sigma 54-interacting transcriptional regulator [Myxococcaceae bacterium]